MTQDTHWSENYFASYRDECENIAPDWVRWLRAGGQLEEWAENTLTDIRFAFRLLDLTEGDTVLNPSCGWGRHALAMAHYGLRVIGLDSSKDLLDLAADNSKQTGVHVQWVQGELDDLELAKPVDAVVQYRKNLLASSQDPAEALYLLDLVHSMLKDGGSLLFGTTDWQASPPRYEQRLAETPDVTENYQRFFDPDSRTILSQTVVQGRDGSRREFWRYSWHPTIEQMAALLYQAEFIVEAQFNDFSFLPYDPALPGLVWLARKV